MKPRSVAVILLLVVCAVWTLAAQPQSSASAVPDDSHLLPLELAGAVSVDSFPNAMVIRCEGFQCSRYHELVYWGYDNKIYFLEAESLAPAASPLLTSDDIASFQNERYLFYDRFYQQIYALDKYEAGTFPDGWYRLEVQIIRGYDYAASAAVNAAANAQTPVDHYYPIDGAALQQPRVNSGAVAKIFIDNPVNGTIDAVTFHGHAPEDALAARFSYRGALACAANPSYCSWHENTGNSLAVDADSNVYIADNNDFIDRIVVRTSGGSPLPDLDDIGTLFDCFIDEAGLDSAPNEELLYLPAGCQSFANGGVAQLDTSGEGSHQVIDLPYYDQGLLVDWSDQKRVFIATTDFDGNYDPDRQLLIHLLYDGQLIATLPVMVDYERGTLSALAFDPYTNLLYLAVEATIYKIKVNYGDATDYPALPAGALNLTPQAADALIASDSSAVFHFGAGAVDEPCTLTYQELPPLSSPPGALLTALSPGLYPLRQFELTAVISATGATLTNFNDDYLLNLYYSPSEIGLITGGDDNLQLYRWSGSAWLPVGATYGSSSANVLYIYTDLTGRFAVLGPTNQLYLPSLLK